MPRNTASKFFCNSASFRLLAQRLAMLDGDAADRQHEVHFLLREIIDRLVGWRCRIH
jgi:hypothetical protein